jgi:AbrB family looped-hinge helix DNA binding protein
MSGALVAQYLNMAQLQEIHIGKQGRVVIPSELRHSLNIKPGQTMVARAENNRLILEHRTQALERIQSRFKKTQQ